MEDEWLPTQKACRFVGIPESTYRQEIKPRLSEDDFRKEGQTIYVRGAAIVELMIEREIRKSTSSDGQCDDDDLDYRNKLADTRIKEARQRKLEREELIEKGELVPLTEIMPSVTWTSSRLKSFGDFLGKKHPNLQRRLNDILRDSLEYWKQKTIEATEVDAE